MLEASGDGLRLPFGVYNARRLTTIPPAFVRKWGASGFPHKDFS